MLNEAGTYPVLWHNIFGQARQLANVVCCSFDTMDELFHGSSGNCLQQALDERKTHAQRGCKYAQKYFHPVRECSNPRHIEHFEFAAAFVFPLVEEEQEQL